MSKAIEYVGVGSIVAFLMISTILPTNATEIIYDKDADLPICVYKEIKDCKTKPGLICVVETTIDPCQDIFFGFTGTDENYKPDTEQFIVPDVGNGDMFCDGKDRDYEGISDLSEPDKGECYSTCEQMSKGLACDIEEREMKSIITVLVALIAVGIPNVYASGLRGDPGDDATEEEAECFINGYDSGFAGKYDSDRAKECIEHRDQYNEMWTMGCEDSLRTEEECGELIKNPVEIEDYEELYDRNVGECNKAGNEDGKAGRPFNKTKDEGCYEFGSSTRGYERGYQQGCETHTTESTCELKYEDKNNYCPNHPDVGGCTEFLQNATNKRLGTETTDYCANVNITCASESNPEKYCLRYDNPFCKTIGDLCDEDGFVKPEYPYCTSR